jgi:hypothetical protein
LEYFADTTCPQDHENKYFTSKIPPGEGEGVAAGRH